MGIEFEIIIDENIYMIFTYKHIILVSSLHYQVIYTNSIHEFPWRHQINFYVFTSYFIIFIFPFFNFRGNIFIEEIVKNMSISSLCISTIIKFIHQKWQLSTYIIGKYIKFFKVFFKHEIEFYVFTLLYYFYFSFFNIERFLQPFF